MTNTSTIIDKNYKYKDGGLSPGLLRTGDSLLLCIIAGTLIIGGQICYSMCNSRVDIDMINKKDIGCMHICEILSTSIFVSKKDSKKMITNLSSIESGDHGSTHDGINLIKKRYTKYYYFNKDEIG